METFYDVMRRPGISRRSLPEGGSVTAMSMGLSPSVWPRIAHAMEAGSCMPGIGVNGLKRTCCIGDAPVRAMG